jgi:hypothetical protein
LKAPSILKHKASISESLYVLNAKIEKSLISKQSDMEENTFDIEDSLILGGSHHIPDIGHFPFLGASISNITVLLDIIGIIYSSIS